MKTWGRASAIVSEIASSEPEESTVGSKVSVKLPVTGSCGAPNSKPDAVKSIVSVIRLADPMAGHIKAQDRISAAMLAVIGALRFLIFSSVTSIARGRKGRALRSTIFIHRDN